MTSTTILGYVIFSGERKPVAGKDTKADNETVNVGYWENHDSIRKHDQTKAGKNKMSETKERDKQKNREWHYEKKGNSGSRCSQPDSRQSKTSPGQRPVPLYCREQQPTHFESSQPCTSTPTSITHANL